MGTFLREYDKVARQCAAEGVDYPRYLLRLDVSPDRVDIRLRTEGLANLVADLSAVRPESRRAA